MPDRIDWAARARAFRFAFMGVAAFVREPHARFHLAAAIAVIALGLVCSVSRLEWAALLLAIAAVWAAEALNSALEHLADAVHPEHHPEVGRAKDIAAGGVLVTAAAAAGVGALVFVPHLAAWLP